MLYTSQSPKETRNIAAGVVSKIHQYKSKNATVIALEGELGAGKTVFAQGVARALGIKLKIKSPTFVVMKNYQAPELESSLYHIDCYRLRDEGDLISLGIEDILAEPKNIVLIEWSERVRKILPKRHIKVHIDHVASQTRKIQISSIKNQR